MSEDLLLTRPQRPAPTLSLSGWSVAVTGAQRGGDVVALLEQRGARVLHVPALRIVRVEDDVALRAATADCLATPFDLVVATTGLGFAAWLEAADGWGLGEELRAALGSARVYARGPKASGVVRASGLPDEASPACESTWDILGRLLAHDLRAKRVVVQLHGAPLDDFTRSLRAAGAEVVEVPVYRTAPPLDHSALERLSEQIVAREVQAVTFTSAAAVTNLLEAAGRRGVLDDLLDAFQEVLPVCVGSVSAAPLERLSVPTAQPQHARLGALVHTLTAALSQKAEPLRAAGQDLEVRATGVVLAGSFRQLPPGPMAVLRVLASQPGKVFSLATLKTALPGGGDEHAVEVAIGRVRTALGDARFVRNVVKRGYSLACDLPPASGAPIVPQVADTPEVPKTASLLNAVGGRSAVREAVERLYARLLADPLVSHYFRDVEMPRLKRHQVLLLTQLLGGPAGYTGRALADAHTGLKITPADYHGVLDHLSAVLHELDVPSADVAAIRAALDAWESTVTNR